MQVELARHVVRAAFRSAGTLSTLIPFLKEHLDAKEYEPYAKMLAGAVAAIEVDLLNKIFAEHPGLEAEVCASIREYGRFL